MKTSIENNQKSIEKNSQRKPLIALSLNLIMPGLGHIYIGQASKGIALLLLISFCMPALSWLAANLPNSLLIYSVLLGVCMTVSLYLYALVDVYKKSQYLNNEYTLRPYNNFYVYLSVFLFGYFFIQSNLVEYSRTHFIAPFIIPSSSMSPNLLAGDIIFSKANYNCLGCKNAVKKGDVVVFTFPNDRTKAFIKRVVGLPSDRIRIEGVNLYINDISISAEPVEFFNEYNQVNNSNRVITEQVNKKTYQVIWSNNKNTSSEKTFETTVANGQVFVLGDNRDNSYDSRHFGTVPLSDIIGKASRVWFSQDTNSDVGVRWDRINHDIEVN